MVALVEKQALMVLVAQYEREVAALQEALHWSNRMRQVERQCLESDREAQYVPGSSSN